MRALATTVQNHVAVSQSKSIGCERYRTDRKGQEQLLGGQGYIGNAREAFAAPMDFQIFQFQPCQPRLEISGARYSEIDARIAESGCKAIRIAKRNCGAFCHMPRPVGPADSSLTVEAMISPRQAASSS